MKILLSGARGLMGSTLVPAWRSQGHRVFTLVRDAKKMQRDGIFWNPPTQGPDPELLTDIDAVVHLAGENIAAQRWTPERKAALYDSRVETTRLLAETFARMAVPPKTFICASAIGFYGHRGDALLTEAAAQPAVQKGIRVVHLRTGIVLSLQGGALVPLRRLFQWGLGGALGSGKQYMSWITLEDVCGVIRQAVTDARFQGPVNVVAPYAVTNREFSYTLARVLRRPSWLDIPAGFLRWIGGEMADEMLLSSIRAQPAALERLGYRFLFPGLHGALQHLLRP